MRFGIGLNASSRFNKAGDFSYLVANGGGVDFSGLAVGGTFVMVVMFFEVFVLDVLVFNERFKQSVINVCFTFE